MTAIYRTWLERLSRERIPHHQVIQLCRAVYPLATGRSPGGKRTNLTTDEAGDITARIVARGATGEGLRATADNEQRGRDWLRQNRKHLGLPGDFDPRDIIEFRLVGFHEYDHRNPGWCNVVHAEPLWRCLLPDGRSFEYAPGAWQRSLSRNDAIDSFHWAWVAP